MEDGSSFYKFLWDYLIYKSDLSKEELNKLEETCKIYSFYPVIMFNLLRSACDLIFQRGYINSDFRNNYSYSYWKKKEVMPQAQNYIQSPQDEVCCRLPDSSFIINARATNEIGINVLEEMLEEAESKSEVEDAVKTIPIADLEEKLINENKILTEYFAQILFTKALERKNMEAISMKILDTAINYSSSGKFVDTVDINTGATIPARLSDGEFCFPPSATSIIGSSKLYEMMIDANQKAKVKEETRANLN